MEHLGNKVTFTADEVETYMVGLEGELTVTLKQDTRTDPAYNLEEQDMAPKINANDIPSYEGHEGVVKSANGGLYDVATDKPDNIARLDGRDVGDVTFVSEEERRDRAIAAGAEDREGNGEDKRQDDEDRSSEGTDTAPERQDDTANGGTKPAKVAKPSAFSTKK